MVGHNIEMMDNPGLGPEIQKALDYWRATHEGEIRDEEDTHISIEYIFSSQDLDVLDYLFRAIFKYEDECDELIRRANNVAKLLSDEDANRISPGNQNRAKEIAFASAIELAQFADATEASGMCDVVRGLEPKCVKYDAARVVKLRNNQAQLSLLEPLTEALVYDEKIYMSGYSSLEPALYHFSRSDTLLSLYMCSPFIHFDINLDHYFELRKLGYTYFIDEKSLFLVPASAA